MMRSKSSYGLTKSNNKAFGNLTGPKVASSTTRVLEGRFVSADSVMSGSASSAHGAATLVLDPSTQLTPLAVDFHELRFVVTVKGENAFRSL
jgi:hypothetical protein